MSKIHSKNSYNDFIDSIENTQNGLALHHLRFLVDELFERIDNLESQNGNEADVKKSAEPETEKPAPAKKTATRKTTSKSSEKDS